MQGKIANLTEIIEKLRTFLPQYLESHEINPNNNFSCLNPKHEDNNPSMSMANNQKYAFCHSCRCTTDIFQAAHWLESKPVMGIGFIEDNVRYLAERFGIEIELEELTEDELYRYHTFKAYQDAATLIADPKFGDYKRIKKEIKKRGWESATTQVGTVVYKEFRNTLKSMGYEAHFQDEIDLGRPDIFNEKNMIFTIKDEWDRPVGFAARNLTYDAKNKESPKYTNQRTTGLRCNIYQKNSRLYEIHTAVKYTPPLYIYEGYTDVITAQDAGLLNCVGIGGTSFTQQHIELLKRLNVNSIVLCLDGDDAGRKKTIDLLDNYFCGQYDLQIEVVNLPDDSDPDSFIREQGLEKFQSLQKWSAFQWRLNVYTDDDNPEDICKTMIPLIVNEVSRITQDRMCGELSMFTGIDKKVISSELERLQNEEERLKHKEKETIIDQMVYDIRRDPSETQNLLYETVGKIEEIDQKHNESNMSIEGSVCFVEQEKAEQEALDGEFAGFTLSPSGLKGYGDVLNGNWKTQSFSIYTGKENTGKTAFCSQLCYEIASIEENNACCIYHSIDDSKEQILPRFVSQAYGHHDLTINQIRNPNYYLKYDKYGKELTQRREMGYQALIRLIKEGRIIIKDVKDGNSFAFGKTLINYYKRKFPNRNIVYFLDNLHKAPDYDNKDERIKFSRLSTDIKNTAVKTDSCIIATAEPKKTQNGVLLTSNDIAESRKMAFDANLLGFLYNDMHEKGVDAECFHEHNGEMMPRLRLGIGKNKITEFKGRLFLDFYPAASRFRFVDTKVAEQDMQKIVRERREAWANRGKKEEDE